MPEWHISEYFCVRMTFMSLYNLTCGVACFFKLTHTVSFNVSTIIIFFSQMMKMRLRAVKL